MKNEAEPSVMVSHRAVVTNQELWDKIDSLQKTVVGRSFPRWAKVMFALMGVSHVGEFALLFYILGHS